MQTHDTIDIPKLARLRSQLEEKADARRAASDSARHANDVVGQRHAFIGQLRVAGQPVPPHTAAELAEAEADYRAARAHAGRIEADTRDLIALVNRLSEFATEAGINVRKLPAYVPLPRVSGPVPTAEQVAAIRARIADQQRERTALKKTPASEAAVFAAIDESIASAAAGFSVAVPMDGRPVKIGLLPFFTSEDVTSATVAVNNAAVESLICSVFPNAIRELLRERATAAAAARGGFGPDGLSRVTRLAELDAEIFALEVEEEQLMVAFEANGMQANRRPDADPRAVLYLPPAVPLASPEHPHNRRTGAGVLSPYLEAAGA